MLWASQVSDAGLGYLITIKNLGGLGFPSPAMYFLALITLSVFLSMKALDLLNVGSEVNLIFLMILVTEKRLQLEPLNSLRNVFDCSKTYGCFCGDDLEKSTKRAMQYYFKTFVSGLVLKCNLALKSSDDHANKVKKWNKLQRFDYTASFERRASPSKCLHSYVLHFASQLLDLHYFQCYDKDAYKHDIFLLQRDEQKTEHGWIART